MRAKQAGPRGTAAAPGTPATCQSVLRPSHLADKGAAKHILHGRRQLGVVAHQLQCGLRLAARQALRRRQGGGRHLAPRHLVQRDDGDALAQLATGQERLGGGFAVHHHLREGAAGQGPAPFSAGGWVQAAQAEQGCGMQRNTASWSAGYCLAQLLVGVGCCHTTTWGWWAFRPHPGTAVAGARPCAIRAWYSLPPATTSSAVLAVGSATRVSLATTPLTRARSNPRSGSEYRKSTAAGVDQAHQGCETASAGKAVGRALLALLAHASRQRGNISGQGIWRAGGTQAGGLAG